MLYNIFLSVSLGIIFYLTGFFISSTFIVKDEEQNQIKLFFENCLIGMLALTTFFAIYKSSFNTILSGIFFITALYILLNKEKFKIKFDLNIRNIDVKILFIYVILLIMFSVIFNHLIFPINFNAHPDYLFYGSISDYLLIHGKENFYLPINSEFFGTTVYHFFNEWMVALISNITYLNGTNSLLYVFFPVTFSVLYLGLIYLSQLILRIQNIYTFFLPLIFFVTSSLSLGESLPVIFNIGDRFSFYYASFFSTPSSGKMIMVTLLILGLIFNSKKDEKTNTIYIFSLICFVWMTTILAVLGGVTVFVLYEIWKSKKVNYNNLSLLTGTFIIFILNFILGPKTITIDNSFSDSYILKFTTYFLEDFNLLELIKTLFKTLLSRVYYYSFLILIILLNYRVIKNFFLSHIKNNKLFTIFLLIFLSALFFRTILFFLSDSNQIFTNIVDNTTMKIIFFSIILIVLQKKWNFIFVFLFASLSIKTILLQKNELEKVYYKKESLITLKNEFNDEILKFATLLKSENSNYTHISQVVYPPLLEIRSISSSYFPVNLSIFDREQKYSSDFMTKSRYVSLMKNSPFVLFTLKNNLEKYSWETKLAFLKKNQINYLIVEDGYLDDNQILDLEFKRIINSFEENVKIYKLF